MTKEGVKRAPSYSSPTAARVAPAPKKRVEPFVDRGLPIPETYGQDVLTAMLRDPSMLFIYWELGGAKTHRLIGRYAPKYWVLIIEDKNVDASSEITIDPAARNWYLRVAAGGRYQLAIGYYDEGGRLHMIARSKVVTTPAAGPSNLSDENEEWMIVERDFRKLLKTSGAGAMRLGASEFLSRARKIRQEIPEKIPSSGAVRRLQLPSSAQMPSSGKLPSSGRLPSSGQRKR
jgi:hypothetical protein